ncbi:MAG: amidohydrolase [Anaerolineae bacterium]|nr:amidohydrolase [Anaerolineae bacterium]
MFKRAQAIADQIIAWRRRVHRHPELAFQEVETARFVAQTLCDMGIAVKTGVGKTGVVGTLGSSSPVIALRADMDALPLTEATGLPFASQNPGAMHACGHDAHVACLLGAAKLLAETPPARGQVRFLFQPAEETVDEEEQSGAMRIVTDGAMDGVDAVLGLHIFSIFPAGQVFFSPGPQMAAAGLFEAHIHGQGGHGAMPHLSVDPIVLAAQVIMGLQTVVSRRLNPVNSGVVTVGTVHGGSKDNIIPESVALTGTIRALDDRTYQQIKDEVRHVFETVRPLGGDFEIRFSANYPVTANEPAFTEFVRGVAVDLFGPQAVQPAEPMMGGEDFSVLAQRAPGCFVRLGGAIADDVLRNHHDPHFDIDEGALPMGVALLAEAAVRYLNQSRL